MTVFIIAAMSVDGFIATHATERSFAWTSSADKQFYIDSIKRAKCVVMGNTTFQTFSKFPRDLTYYVYTSQPEKFINPKPEVIKAYGTNLSPAQLITQLQAEGVTEVAICGGASVYTQFLQAGVVNKLYLTVEPVLFGQGVSLFNQPLTTKLTLVNSELLAEQTLLLEYDLT